MNVFKEGDSVYYIKSSDSEDYKLEENFKYTVSYVTTDGSKIILWESDQYMYLDINHFISVREYRNDIINMLLK